MASPSSNIFWLTASRIGALAVLFFAYTRLFRYLGPFESGQYQLILSFTAIFGVLIDFGIGQYIIKKISQDLGSTKRYFQNFFLVEIFLSCLVFLSMLSLAYLQGYDKEVFWGIVVGGSGVAISGLATPFLSVLSAHQDLKRVAFINFLSSIINVVFILTTIFFNRSIIFLTGNQLAFSVVSFLVYSYYIQRYIPLKEVFSVCENFNKPLILKIFKASIPFALLAGFSTLYNRIDIILISKLLGYEQTGLYTAAYKFFDLIVFFPAVVSHSLYPVFNSLLARGEIQATHDIFHKYLKLMLALALPMGVLGSLFAGQIIQLIAGSEFALATPVLSVLIWAPVSLFIYIIANSLVISQLTKFAVLVTCLNVILNITGNLILLPRYGIIASAFMTVISEVFQGLFYFYFVNSKLLSVKFWELLPQPLLASLLMLFLLWPFRNYTMFVMGFLGLFVYFASLFLTGYFKKQDLEVIKRMLQRS